MLLHLNSREDSSAGTVVNTSSKSKYSRGITFGGISGRDQGVVGGVQVTHLASVHVDDPAGPYHLRTLKVRNVTMR